MNSFLVILYSVVLTLVFFIFIFHLLSLKQKKKITGKIQAQWSSFYNFSSIRNRIILSLLFLYFLWCVYQIISEPKSSNGYHRLIILIIFLGFTPRRNVYVGSEGILLKMKFISWKNISKKKIVARNNRKYLEIRGALSPGLSRMEMKKVFLPRNVCRILENRKRKPDSFKSLFG